MALARLFPPARLENVFEDEDNQSFEEFLEMGQREPNEQGTGRVKLTQVRNKVQVILFTSSKSRLSKPKHLPALVSFISKFLMLEVDYREQLGALDLATGTFTLDGLEYDITPPPAPKRRKKAGKPSAAPASSVDVFELFDVLVHAAQAPYASIVGLFDFTLTEDDREVMGRACGDRVCCISLPQCDGSLAALLATACHELLHTLGVDHATEERCVMNAISSAEDGDCLWLCLSNLRKLVLMHQEWGEGSPLGAVAGGRLLRGRNGGSGSGSGGGGGSKSSSSSCESKGKSEDLNGDADWRAFVRWYHQGLLGCARDTRPLQSLVAWLEAVVEAFGPE